MSWFFVTSNDVANALEAAVEYMSKVRVFVEADLVPGPAGLVEWLMEYSAAYELRKLTVKFDRIPASGVPQDPAMFTVHWINITSGVPDATWTTADYTAIENGFDAWFTANAGIFAPSLKLSEFIWRADGPAFRPFGGSLSPTLRRTARSVLGQSAAQALPPQLAVTVTEVIPATFVAHDVEGVGDQVRNRWGRFYIPAPAVTVVTNGRLGSGFQTSIADATETWYESGVSQGIYPVVYSPTTGHSWTVAEIHVDDIFDVQRSRRFITPLARMPRTITQPT